jgi:hypothetical protein
MSNSLDKKTKVLFVVLLLLICSSVVFSAYKYFVKRDYSLYARVSCDPEKENCFVEECDTDKGECTGEDKTYYKFILKSAQDAPLCISEDGTNTCKELVCSDGESCEAILCSEEYINEFEIEGHCSSPQL